REPLSVSIRRLLAAAWRITQGVHGGLGAGGGGGAAVRAAVAGAADPAAGQGEGGGVWQHADQRPLHPRPRHHLLRSRHHLPHRHRRPHLHRLTRHHHRLRWMIIIRFVLAGFLRGGITCLGDALSCRVGVQSTKTCSWRLA
ncbi:unnamed protein product, partial [Musa textilis]